MVCQTKGSLEQHSAGQPDMCVSTGRGWSGLTLSGLVFVSQVAVDVWSWLAEQL